MLSVNYAESCKQAYCAECHYAECRYAECRYAECHGAKSRQKKIEGVCEYFCEYQLIHDSK